MSTRSERQNRECVEYVAGNAHDEAFLRTLLSRGPWDAVVDFMTYKSEEFSRRAALFLGSTKQYIYLSSSRVYAESSVPIKEDSPRLLDVCGDEAYLATDEYALAKARQEDILRKSGRKNWTIIRPYITFSESRLQLSPLEKEFWLYRALKGRTIVFSKDIADRLTTFTYGYDVACGIEAVIGKETAMGEAFHITTSECHKWSEILDIYLTAIEKATGRRPKVMMTERWTSELGGGAEQVKYDRLYDRCFDNTKISQFIDTATFRPIESALSDCISTFVANPQFLHIDWASEARKDRLTGEWTNIKEITGVRQKLKYLMVRLGLY